MVKRSLLLFDNTCWYLLMNLSNFEDSSKLDGVGGGIITWGEIVAAFCVSKLDNKTFIETESSKLNKKTVIQVVELDVSQKLRFVLL